MAQPFVLDLLDPPGQRVPHPSFCKEWVGDARERVPTLCDFLCALFLLRAIEGGPLLRCSKAGRRCCRQSALVSAFGQDQSRIVLILNRNSIPTAAHPFAHNAKAWGPTEWIVPARSKALASLDNPPPGATRTVLQGFAFPPQSHRPVYKST